MTEQGLGHEPLNAQQQEVMDLYMRCIKALIVKGGRTADLDEAVASDPQAKGQLNFFRKAIQGYEEVYGEIDIE